MRRVVYRGGYIQFANLNYRGEHLEGYTGNWVVLRYNPRDITSILIYREDSGKDSFLSRAHATELETEMLSYAEAQAMSRRLRKAGKTISNDSIFTEVRELRYTECSRDRDIEDQQRRQKKRSSKGIEPSVSPSTSVPLQPIAVIDSAIEETPLISAVGLEDEAAPRIEVPDVRVYDYEAMKQEYELW